MQRMKFKEFFNELPSSLFTAIANNTRLATLEYLKLLFTSDDGNEYDLLYLIHSGDKYISKTCMYMLDDDIVEPSNISTLLADLIILKYGSNWNKMLKAFTSEYDPIENYNRIEHEEYNSKIKNTSNSSRYGFNTPVDTPVGDTDIESESSGTKDDNFRDANTHGNIGVTSSQDMIRQELDLRKENILSVIFNDIDTMLCLKVY